MTGPQTCSVTDPALPERAAGLEDRLSIAAAEPLGILPQIARAHCIDGRA